MTLADPSVSAEPITSDDGGDSVSSRPDNRARRTNTEEIINVRGKKVYPAEVESVIQEIANVREVTVYGEKNPITGNIVCAKVSLSNDEDQKAFALRYY